MDAPKRSNVPVFVKRKRTRQRRREWARGEGEEECLLRMRDGLWGAGQQHRGGSREDRWKREAWQPSGGERRRPGGGVEGWNKQRFSLKHVARGGAAPVVGAAHCVERVGEGNQPW